MLIHEFLFQSSFFLVIAVVAAALFDTLLLLILHSKYQEIRMAYINTMATKLQVISRIDFLR